MSALPPPKTRTDILFQPLSHNPFILNDDGQVLFNREFIDGGYTYVSDIFYEIIPHSLPALEIYDNIVALNPETRITYVDICKHLSHILDCIPQEWCTKIFSDDKIVSTQVTENLSLRIKVGDAWEDAGGLTAKRASLLLRLAGATVPKGQQFWQNYFPQIGFKSRWPGVYGGIKDNLDADLDFKILHNILFTNDRLYKYKMISSPLCSLCNSEEETVHHLFIHCPITHIFWSTLTSKVGTIISVSCWEEATLLGLDLPKKNCEGVLINFLLNIYKKTIWNTRIAILKSDNSHCNIDIPLFFHNSLKKKLNLIYHYFKKIHKLHKFWGIFDQGEISVILTRHEDCSYEYIFDKQCTM